jgi:DNA-binding transcriptional ArsR family regulator
VIEVREVGGEPGDVMASNQLRAFKAQFFRALAHPVRIRILEILVRGGRTVQELQEALGLEQPIVSQQLVVLRNQSIVKTQKEGVFVRYTVRDPLIAELLDVARRIFNNHLVTTRGMLRELRRERPSGTAGPGRVRKRLVDR